MYQKRLLTGQINHPTTKSYINKHPLNVPTTTVQQTLLPLSIRSHLLIHSLQIKYQNVPWLVSTL